MRVRIPWQLPVAAALLALLAVLGTLQYRWLGEVSDAERDRMRAAMRARAADVAQQFNAQLTRAFIAFHVDPAAFDRDAAATLADASARWRGAAAAPALVRDVYVVERTGGQPTNVQRLVAERRTLEPATLPAALAASLARTAQQSPIPEALDSRVPALFIAMPRVQRTEVGGGRVALYTNGLDAMRVIAVELDAERLQHDVLEPLITQQFGDPRSDSVVTVVRRDSPSTVVFNSGTATIDAGHTDVAMPLFDLRMDDITRVTDHAGLPPPATATKERFAITIVRRANGAAAMEDGAWELRVRHRLGSLEEVVARSRRRNVSVGLGVLALLGASVVLIIAAAQRQQRLARQQMQFVAAVSHDLRTPLAVICSAGENLADGVVADTSQVKQYGALIRTEGRRLHDMVERVMAFAGITSGAPIRARRGVDVAQVVRDAVASADLEARGRGIRVHVSGDATLPPVAGDADALRSAVQNVLDNAIKYSPAAGVVDVVTEAGPEGGVRIRIADRGAGIDAADLGRVFDPFFRGRRAIDSQVRGSGIGLSVVRHVLEAHHGTATIESTVGAGTTVTMTVPILQLHDRPARREARTGEARA